jgi:invasion associated locus B (IalB) protein
VVALGLIATPFAAAQEEAPRVDAKRDWGVFTGGSPKECWIVSAPTESSAKRGGETVTVRRGDIMLMVSIRPAESVDNEVSFAAGYPVRENSTVNLRIGSQSFELFVDGETAWPASSDEDEKVITSMRRGSSATVTGLSKRGTTTIDKFSLLGFTAALESAHEMCK